MKIPNRSKHYSFGGAVCAGVVLLMASAVQAQNLFVASSANSTIYEIAPSGAKTIFSTAVHDPADVAFDRAGDLFVTDYHDSIFEFRNINGTLSTTPVTFASGLDEPAGLAFDGAGDLFVGCATAVVEYQSINGTLSSTPTSFASGLDGADSLVFDSAGDLFVSDYYGGLTATGYEFLYQNGTLSSTPVPIQDLAFTSGMAFDNAGDLFLSLPAVPESNWDIFEVPNNNGTLNWNQVRIFASGSGLVTPYGLAFDTTGDLFAAALNGGNVIEFVNNQGTLSSTPTVFASGLDAPWGVAFQPGTSCYPVPSGIVNWWPAEGNALDIVGGNNGTLQGGVTYTTGEVRQAFNLDGATGFISTSTLINNPQTFSLTLWFKTATTNGGVLISFDSSQSSVADGSQFDRNIYMDDTGTLYFGFWNPGPQQISSAAGYNNNIWHQVVGSLSASTGLSLYVDGVLAGNNPAATSAANYNGYWRFGEDNLNNWPNQPTSYYFQGQIDEVAIFNTALSSTDVAAIYGAGGAGMCSPSCCDPRSLTISLLSQTPPKIELMWSGCGTLQSETSVTGSWMDVPGATSPYITAATGAAFFKLNCP